MTALHPVWTGEAWVDMPVPDAGGIPLVMPNVAALVYGSDARDRILMQRRDKPGEVVRGRWELPGGRWEAGERPDVAVAREVEEETGVRVTAVCAAVEVTRHRPHIATATARPLSVVVGIDGAYPALLVLFECRGEGEPRALPGETADPSWWDVADVLRLLDDDPEAFVWQSAALLRSALLPAGRGAPDR